MHVDGGSFLAVGVLIARENIRVLTFWNPKTSQTYCSGLYEWGRGAYMGSATTPEGPFVEQARDSLEGDCIGLTEATRLSKKRREV